MTIQETIKTIDELKGWLKITPSDIRNLNDYCKKLEIENKQLILNNVDDKLKVKEVVSFDDWAKKQGYKQDFFYFKKYGNYLNPMELYKKYKDEVLNR